MTTKIVVNRTSYGGFSLSVKGVLTYAKLKGIQIYAYQDVGGARVRYEQVTLETCNPNRTIHYSTKQLAPNDDINKTYFSERNIPRDDPALVQAVETLGEEANSKYSELKVIEIPSNVEWYIFKDDGFETIHEKHRFW